jgi:hypothetical protein
MSVTFDLSQPVRDAVGQAVLEEFRQQHQITANVPPNDLKDAYDAAIDVAMRNAAQALQSDGSAARDLNAFAKSIASGAVVKTPVHGSTMRVTLNLETPLDLTPAQRQNMATKIGVCPFVGPKIAQGDLPLYGSKDNPLIKIEDVVRAAGPGTLGEHVLQVFAEGNQTKMVGSPGKLDAECPAGFMSAHLLGSKGSHGANSGILHDPLDRRLGAGRRSREDFEWLRSFANADGKLDVEGMGKAIGARMHEYAPLDETVTVAGRAVFSAMGVDVVNVIGHSIPAIAESAENAIRHLFRREGESDEHREFIRSLTSLTGENTLIGSAGEWALLFAGWANAPGVRQPDGSVQLDFKQIEPQFFEGRTPEAFANSEKSAIEWAKLTAQITLHAFKEFHRLRET